MASLHLLGTGAALSDATRTTTMLAVEADSLIVVDCGGDVVQRMLAAGLDLDRIELLILTHEHPDHISGFPLFMEKIWLSGRRRPLPVAGPAPTLERARRVFEVYDTSGWKGLPSIEWREVPLEEGAKVASSEEWRITATPGLHGVPVVGVRIEHAAGGAAMAYSADTEPTDGFARLAAGVDLLVHEATGDFRGHASATGAAGVATKAGARRLILVHLPPNPNRNDLERARGKFPDLELGEDGATYSF